METKKIFRDKKNKILNLIFIFFLFISFSYAVGELRDIYYNPGNQEDEINNLIDNGIIIDKNNLGDFLKRDEFVGILEEINCVQCRGDNISEDIKNKYLGKIPFFDLSVNNSNALCIADAKAKGITIGYTPGHICENGIGEEGKIPFCPENKIKLEEAIAMLFRSSKLFTISDARKVINDINSGKITEKLALDVSPKLNNGQAYSFYGDIRKALNYSIEEYDENGNKKIYHMLKVGDDGKIHPEKYVTRKEFFDMAYIIFKTNSCLNGVRLGQIDGNSNYKLGTNIRIFDSSCEPNNIDNCKQADLNPKNNIFDFYGEVGGVCSLGVKNPDGYRWEFYNKDTKKREIKFGKFINDYSFLEAGNYEILLRVVDNCGNIGYSKFDFYYDGQANYGDWVEYPDDSNFKIRIIAKPISGEKPLEVIFVGESYGDGVHRYIWEIEGNKIEGQQIKYVFKEDGEYKVKLKVIDENGREINSETTIKVGDSNNINLDLEIIANPISGESPLETNLKAKVLNKTGNFTYSWFIDGEKIDGQEIKYLFTKPGKHKVNLLVEDENGNKGVKEIVIDVKESNKKQNIKVEITYGKNKILEKTYTNFIGKITPEKPNNGKYTYTWYIGGEARVTPNPKITQYFRTPGLKIIKLKVEDEDGNIGVGEVKINVEPRNPNGEEKIGFNISINANPLSGYVPLAVRFEAIVSDFGNPGDFEYSWYIENIFIPGKIINYSFKKVGTYKVTLKVKDKLSGQEKQAFVSIRVKSLNENPNRDTDGDGIPDLDDDCILIPGVKENNGCPIDSKKCNSDCSCDDDTKKCNTSNINICSKVGLCIPKTPNGDGDNPDTDGDGVPDLDDDCVFVPGEVENNGCPIDSKNCDSNCDCNDGKICNTQEVQFCSTIGVCIPGGNGGDNPGNGGITPPGENPRIPPKDTDGDGIPDLDDDCVFEFGVEENNGCPSLADSCDANCKCSNPGYKCNTKNKDTCSKTGICIPNNRCNADCSCNPGYRCSITPGAGGSCDMNGVCVKANSCLDNLSNGVGIFGNAICDTCPCDINVDFSSTLQVCDIIFPAILSPDGKEIYSKGENKTIK